MSSRQLSERSDDECVPRRKESLNKTALLTAFIIFRSDHIRVSFPLGKLTLLMSVTLDAHATFMTDGRSRKDTSRKIRIGYSNLFDLYDKNHVR